MSVNGTKSNCTGPAHLGSHLLCACKEKPSHRHPADFPARHTRFGRVPWSIHCFSGSLAGLTGVTMVTSVINLHSFCFLVYNTLCCGYMPNCSPCTRVLLCTYHTKHLAS